MDSYNIARRLWAQLWLIILPVIQLLTTYLWDARYESKRTPPYACLVSRNAFSPTGMSLTVLQAVQIFQGSPLCAEMSHFDTQTEDDSDTAFQWVVVPVSFGTAMVSIIKCEIYLHSRYERHTHPHWHSLSHVLSTPTLYPR